MYLAYWNIYIEDIDNYNPGDYLMEIKFLWKLYLRWGGFSGGGILWYTVVFLGTNMCTTSITFKAPGFFSNFLIC